MYYKLHVFLLLSGQLEERSQSRLKKPHHKLMPPNNQPPDLSLVIEGQAVEEEE